MEALVYLTGPVETVKVDRGLELNRKRLAGHGVDVHFLVEDQTFPAHRLIIGLHSNYLKTLTDPSSAFIER